MNEVTTIIGVDLAKNVFQLHGHRGRHYHQSGRPRRNYTSSIITMAYAPENVGFQVLSLRQSDPVEHSPLVDDELERQVTARFWRRALDCGPGKVGSAPSLSALFLLNSGLKGWWYGFLKS